VVAYLQQLDLSGFDPNATPPKTPAFWAIVNASSAPEHSELADLLDSMDNPKAVTLEQMIEAGRNTEIGLWLEERKNRRPIPHRMGQTGYVPLRNPDSKSRGDWKIGGKRRVIYVNVQLSPRDQLTAARKIVTE
jgi:hypothetical protein